MIYRYIYKITCTKGSFKDKFYLGKHTTENLDDGYKGSGVLLWRYYKKYPNDYIKEIIAFYNTDEELNKAEYDIIHPYLYDKNCLNLSEGGNGGKVKGVYKHTEETINRITNSMNKYWSEHEGPMTGKHHTLETKLKQSKSLKGKLAGEKNPMYNIGIKHPMYGKHQSEESKRKNRLSHLGKVTSDETKQKLSKITSRKRWLKKDNEKPIYVDISLVDYYLNLGYHKGRK